MDATRPPSIDRRPPPLPEGPVHWRLTYPLPLPHSQHHTLPYHPINRLPPARNPIR